VHIASTVKERIDAVHGGDLRMYSGLVHHIQHGGVDMLHALEAFEHTGVDVSCPDGCALGHHGQNRRLANALTGCGDEYVFAL